MSIPIEGPVLPLLAPREPVEAFRPAETQDSDGVFETLLKGVVEAANTGGLNAQRAGEAFAAGARDDIHGTMLALSTADIQLRFAGSVRNKVVDAFYELWRMQV